MPYTDRQKRKAYSAKYYAANKEKAKQYNKQYRLIHPDKAKSSAWKRNNPERARELQYLAKYGITLQDYEELQRAQKGLCAICQGMSQGKRLAVDHDHETGQVRGLLCSRCNVALGGFWDSSRLLRRAAVYLEMADANST